MTLGPIYTDLTKQCLRASEGLANPWVQLRVTEDMPKDIWNLALERVLCGGGQPSFYNEKKIQERLERRLPHAPKEDLMLFTGAGCTEANFAGLTFCGGVDYSLNVLQIFEKHMKTSLGSCSDFQEFYDCFCQKVTAEQDEAMKFINHQYNVRAGRAFAPIRTLFTDDCIDNEKGFFQGGSRYTFSILVESGIPNTIDSLLAVKHLVYEKKLYTAETFIAALESQDPQFLAMLKTCPCYGVENEEADALMEEFTTKFYKHYLTGKLDLGLGFLPSSSQFNRHPAEGKVVGATPDGRPSGHPVADSIAAMNGKAVKGPTAMLNSASHFVQEDIFSIPILNLSIARQYPKEILRSLIESYFAMNGTQIQITCVDRKMLIEAKENPEMHRDLIVRVGGYSDFFRNLSTELQDALIERTLFECP